MRAMETVQRFHSPRFLYYRKLRHSVVEHHGLDIEWPLFYCKQNNLYPKNKEFLKKITIQLKN